MEWATTVAIGCVFDYHLNGFTFVILILTIKVFSTKLFLDNIFSLLITTHHLFHKV